MNQLKHSQMNHSLMMMRLKIKDLTQSKKHRLVNENLRAQYGPNPHPLILKRVEKELNSIISNHFAPIYYISYLLVKKSLEDGYLVGSRGSVGSSLVATLLKITEVNPLPPHYYCENHDFTALKLTQNEILEFGQSREQMKFEEVLNSVESGYDLPDRKCPICKAPLKKMDIVFRLKLS